MSADVERMRERHWKGATITAPGCGGCYQTWPCDAVKLADAYAALRDQADAAEARAFLLLDALDDYSRVSSLDLGTVLEGVFRGDVVEPKGTEAEARALRDALLAVTRLGRAAGEGE